jgi:HAE1 family hydrophobic/amphiphilic exporter-1
MSVVQHVVKRPVLGIVVFGLIAIVALYLVSDIAIDMFPETSMPMLVVVTSYSGAGPETVEKSVTRVLEAQLVNLSGLTDMSSSSSVSITGIAGILAAQNIELGAGSIVEGSKNYSVRTTGEYKALADIAETVIAKRNNTDIRLLDIADIALGYPDESSTVYINGESGVYVGVTKQSGANSAAVADRVYGKLEEIQKLLPRDVSLEITQDDTTQIRDMINELVNSALLGAALAMTILFVFLRNIKSAVIIGISIPFSILVTFLVMSLLDISLNMLTMAGLVLGIGMIVDNSIVILENIFKYRERGTKPDIAAILGSGEVMSSIVSSTLTTLCVFVPIFLFKNRLEMMGELFQGLIFTVGVSLASSLFVAIFLVPILSSTYLPLEIRIQKPLKNKAWSA